jgi:hypothetical protein
MLSKRLLLFSFVGIALLASPAFAKGNWALVGNAAYGIPTGDWSDRWDAAANYGAGVEYDVDKQLTIGADFAYMKCDPTDSWQTTLDQYGLTGKTFTTTRYGAYVKWSALKSARNFTPYFKAGVSLYDLQDDVTIPAIQKEGSMTAIGPNGGIGFLYWPGAKLGLGLEGMYHFPIADATKMAFDSTPYWTVGASVVFKLGKKAA